MNQFEGLLLLFGLLLGLLLAGYWLAAMLATDTPAVRLAVAPLAGLGSLLFGVSVVNFFVPLAGGWALLCLAPIGATLVWPTSRDRLFDDLAAFGRAPGAPWLIGLGAVFLVGLLWPMLLDGQCVFYDGTSNHDSFFWISGAEHLKRHAYMVPPVESATQPLTNAAAAFTGWTPLWGRMGAEGLLALSSSVSWTSPLKLYLYATACLFLPWLAGVYLAVRTFYSERLSFGAKAALVAFQPLFIFYYSNANLPNLLGALTGSAAVIATEQLLRPSASRRAWWIMLVLSLHGLACTYPEMLPFVLLPCCLLWLRPRATWRRRGGVVAAVFAGAVINPATAVRAYHGFAASFAAARTNESWSNIFESLNFAEYFPGLTSLSVTAARHLGPGLGALMTLVLVASLGLAWWKARDRFGAAAVFAGSAVLAVYTLATGFAYGWQKTVQFGGVFFAAAVSVAILDAQWSEVRVPGSRRRLAWAGLGLTVAFLLFAVLMGGRDIGRWGVRKIVSQDWFQLRERSRGPLHDAPILIEGASFQMAFFYSMWSAYFLPESRLYFGARGDQNGGYLGGKVIREGSRPVPKPQAILVGRAWADSFDANSPRLVIGLEYALLEKNNRVLEMEGVYPLNGLPEIGSTDIALVILPHSASDLVFRLAPRGHTKWPDGTWRVIRQTDGAGELSIPVSGPPPWTFKIPLVARQNNRLRVTFPLENKTGLDFPFKIDDLHVEGSP